MSNRAGYVKTYRDIQDSPIWQDAELFKTWMWIKLNAQYQPVDEPVSTGRGSIMVHLEPGQLVFQRNAVAQELGASPSTVYDRIKKLQRMGYLSIQADNQYSIISIINCDTCQGGSGSSRQPSDNQTDNQSPNFPTTKNAEKNNQNDVFESKPKKIRQPKNKDSDNRSDTKKLYKEVKEYTPPKSPPGDDGGFGSFWQEYPRKVAKQAALKAWEKTAKSRPPQPELLAALKEQKRSLDWQKENGRYIPHPATWLNQGRWDDEVQNYELEDDTEVFRPYLRGGMQ